ncbi:hypothetical protein TSUD_283650 [Trifolium subterraneum]|uniref:Uncharacterized protein n=1 Tax=Trifolium subterraneum TaxID=3900 RepID=A0A2Z6P3K3_TRISU|nr:hypothetical protein TSUD_283650 [Trifolium subterraneum]
MAIVLVVEPLWGGLCPRLQCWVLNWVVCFSFEFGLNQICFNIGPTGWLLYSPVSIYFSGGVTGYVQFVFGLSNKWVGFKTTVVVAAVFFVLRSLC